MTIVISEMKHVREFGHSTHTTDVQRPDGPSATESYEKVFIKPGANFFEREAELKWLRIRNSMAAKKAIDKLIEEGDLKETISKPITAKGGKVAKGAKNKKGAGVDSGDGLDSAPDNLKDFEAKMAIEIVEGTHDIKNLEAWNKDEDRSNVRQAIKKQSDIIRQLDKARKEAQENQG